MGTHWYFLTSLVLAHHTRQSKRLAELVDFRGIEVGLVALWGKEPWRKIGYWRVDGLHGGKDGFCCFVLSLLQGCSDLLY